MYNFKELYNAHRGKSFCIMGGNDDLLPEHLDQVKADVYISPNGHGCTIKQPDYCLALDYDYGRGGITMLDHCRQFTDAPVISPQPWADIVMDGYQGYPTRTLSGAISIWAAQMMGASVVYLCGMDAYNGKKRRSYELLAPTIDVPVRVVGGGFLTNYWPEYRKGERFKKVSHNPINTPDKFKARIKKSFIYQLRELREGEELWVYTDCKEAMSRLRHRMIEPLCRHRRGNLR